MDHQLISDILVFKTNITETHDLEKIGAVLDNDPRVKKWNIDCADVDKVLRVQSYDLGPEEIAQLVIGAGFYCEELPD